MLLWGRNEWPRPEQTDTIFSSSFVYTASLVGKQRPISRTASIWEPSVTRSCAQVFFCPLCKCALVYICVYLHCCRGTCSWAWCIVTCSCGINVHSAVAGGLYYSHGTVRYYARWASKKEITYVYSEALTILKKKVGKRRSCGKKTNQAQKTNTYWTSNRSTHPTNIEQLLHCIHSLHINWTYYTYTTSMLCSIYCNIEL